MSKRTNRWAAVGVVAVGLGASMQQAFTQPPAAAPAPASEPTLIDPMSKDYGSRPIAFVYGNVPITRAHLAEYLIARGGHEKVELLVNTFIIETEAKRRGITVTQHEMEATFEADLQISNPPIQKKDFINVLLPRWGKTYFEYMEDVLRPRLLLSKMCQDRVKVTEEDVKKLYERDHGEKRLAKIIIWPKGDNLKSVQQAWDQLRKSDAEFDRAARGQANGSLAATGGEIKPIARFQIGDDKDKRVEEIAFALNEGEVSQIFETNQGYMVLKLIKKLPPDGTPMDKVKDRLTKEAYDLKLTAEIPKMFQELSKGAAPNILLNSPPSQWRFVETAKEMARDVEQSMPKKPTPPPSK